MRSNEILESFKTSVITFFCFFDNFGVLSLDLWASKLLFFKKRSHAYCALYDDFKLSRSCVLNHEILTWHLVALQLDKRLKNEAV